MQVKFKLAEQTLKLMERLDDVERAAVDAQMHTYLKACVKHGSPIENLDRVILESIEVTRLEARLGETRSAAKSVEHENWPPMTYPQYVSPRGDN
jgi:hypothetical protein